MNIRLLTALVLGTIAIGTCTDSAALFRKKKKEDKPMAPMKKPIDFDSANQQNTTEKLAFINAKISEMDSKLLKSAFKHSCMTDNFATRWLGSTEQLDKCLGMSDALQNYFSSVHPNESYSSFQDMSYERYKWGKHVGSIRNRIKELEERR